VDSNIPAAEGKSRHGVCTEGSTASYPELIRRYPVPSERAEGFFAGNPPPPAASWQGRAISLFDRGVRGSLAPAPIGQKPWGLGPVGGALGLVAGDVPPELR